MSEEIKLGDMVKISFKDCERMWIKVTEVNDEEITGILNNSPVTEENQDLKFGDEVKFHRDQILGICSFVKK